MAKGWWRQAILNAGSERNILTRVAPQLNPNCHLETLPLQTVHQNIKELHGALMSLEISLPLWPSRKHQISDTAEGLALTKLTDPDDKPLGASITTRELCPTSTLNQSVIVFRTTKQTCCHLHSAVLVTSKASWYCFSFTWTPDRPACRPSYLGFLPFWACSCPLRVLDLSHAAIPYLLHLPDVIY